MLLSLLKALAVVLGVLAIVVRAIAYYFRAHQDKLLYYPDLPPSSRDTVDHPGLWGVPTWEEITVVSSAKVTLHGYFLHQENPTAAPTVVYFHGNAGNIGHRIPLALALFRSLGCNVVLVEYRGYGLSSGVPSEEGLRLDAIAALEYVHSVLPIDRKRVVVMGTSLGGAVAIYAAVTRPNLACAVVVENTFTSIPDMVDVMAVQVLRTHFRPPTVRALALAVRFVLKPLVLHIQWNSVSAVRKLRQPILFLSGKKDELVPPSQMHDLYTRAGRSSRRVFVPLPNGTHNDTWCCELYFESIGRFLTTSLPPATPQAGGTPCSTGQGGSAVPGSGTPPSSSSAASVMGSTSLGASGTTPAGGHGSAITPRLHLHSDRLESTSPSPVTGGNVVSAPVLFPSLVGGASPAAPYPSCGLSSVGSAVDGLGGGGGSGSGLGTPPVVSHTTVIKRGNGSVTHHTITALPPTPTTGREGVAAALTELISGVTSAGPPNGFFV
eukprot:RCo008340